MVSLKKTNKTDKVFIYSIFLLFIVSLVFALCARGFELVFIITLISGILLLRISFSWETHTPNIDCSPRLLYLSRFALSCLSFFILFSCMQIANSEFATSFYGEQIGQAYKWGVIASILAAILLDFLTILFFFFIRKGQYRILKENLLKINLQLNNSKIYTIDQRFTAEDNTAWESTTFPVVDLFMYYLILPFFSWAGSAFIFYVLVVWFRSEISLKENKNILYNKLKIYPQLSPEEVFTILKQIYTTEGTPLVYFSQEVINMLKTPHKKIPPYT